MGRLDFDTTGLLIMTNDGDFAAKVSHPSSEIEKEYIVEDKVFTKENVDEYLEDRSY